jgi:Mg2+ and Co2+ transporter CorA
MLSSVLRAMDRGPDGKVSVIDGESALAPPPEGTRRWIDLEGEPDEVLERLRTGFDFHPLAIEDASSSINGRSWRSIATTCFW